MPTDEKDIAELAEGSMRDLYEGLNKMQLDDPKRENIMKEIEAHSKIVDSYESRDQRRMDNNAKNDIEEQRVIIDQQKVLNDKARNRNEIIKMFFQGVCIGAFSYGAYHMDKFHLPNKRLLNYVDDFIRRIIR